MSSGIIWFVLFVTVTINGTVKAKDSQCKGSGVSKGNGTFPFHVNQLEGEGQCSQHFTFLYSDPIFLVLNFTDLEYTDDRRQCNQTLQLVSGPPSKTTDISPTPHCHILYKEECKDKVDQLNIQNQCEQSLSDGAEIVFSTKNGNQRKPDMRPNHQEQAARTRLLGFNLTFLYVNCETDQYFTLPYQQIWETTEATTPNCIQTGVLNTKQSQISSTKSAYASKQSHITSSPTSAWLVNNSEPQMTVSTAAIAVPVGLIVLILVAVAIFIAMKRRTPNNKKSTRNNYHPFEDTNDVRSVNQSATAVYSVAYGVTMPKNSNYDFADNIQPTSKPEHAISTAAGEPSQVRGMDPKLPEEAEVVENILYDLSK